MFKLESMLLEKIRSAFTSMQPSYAGPNYVAFCHGCVDYCANNCKGGCSALCKGGCQNSCKGFSR